MTKIPFTKAHGARNDFLLTWSDALPEGVAGSAGLARAICDRHTGIGADGWILVTPGAAGPDAPFHCAIDLWNSDGSRSEISGNGTRCAAALVIDAGGGSFAESGAGVRISTGAGLKSLRLLAREGVKFSFEMNMGRAAVEALYEPLEGLDATILNVGNPQCAFFVADFDLAWQAVGARVERHARFPQRTNVSFVKVVDEHTLDVRFFERGAGETMSSGTGSTGAAAAAAARGLVRSPVRVLTPAGPLDLRWDGGELLLAGPAELIGAGEFFYSGERTSG